MPGTMLPPGALQILYEDNHLLAVYKPAGVLVQSDRTGDPSLQDTARAWLKERYRKPGNVFLGIVHRLDRPVAGVVVFARTSKAAARLSARFRAREVEKRYLAVVHGVPSPGEARLAHELVRDEGRRRSLVVPAGTRGARPCVLHYRVREQAPAHALVEIRPETGRAHQIRVQMAHLGHPLLGDTKYGAPFALPNRAIALFAVGLRIAHPVRDEVLELSGDVPPGWPWPPPASTARTHHREGAERRRPRSGGRRRR